MTATTRGHGVNSDHNRVPLDGGLDDSVSCALWVYLHVAWLNMLAVEPGWLSAVYQDQ